MHWGTCSGNVSHFLTPQTFPRAGLRFPAVPLCASHLVPQSGQCFPWSSPLPDTPAHSIGPGTVLCTSVQFSSVTQLCPTLQPHELKHTRPPSPSPTPRVYPNWCPLSRWCHPTISSSVTLLLLPLIFPSIRAFSNGSALHIRWPKYWSFSFSIKLPMNIQDWFPFGLTCLILQSKGHSKVKRLFSTPQCKSIELQCSAFFMVQISHPYMITVTKVMSLLFDMLGLSQLFFQGASIS